MQLALFSPERLLALARVPLGLESAGALVLAHLAAACRPVAVADLPTCGKEIETLRSTKLKRPLSFKNRGAQVNLIDVLNKMLILYFRLIPQVKEC